MTAKYPQCVAIEADLVAAATGEAAPPAAGRVRAHIERCAPCRDDFGRYQAIETVVGQMRPAGGDAGAEARARARLEARLADVKRRLVTYRIFPSPLGNILIARSEQGITMVEYLGKATDLHASRLRRLPGVEAVEDGEELEAYYVELGEYLEGKRILLEWPLDLRLARGEFDRMVLQATAAIPYGAVTSYAGIARDVGRPAAARAVAQALRWNPIPIAVPCHRVIGTTGCLTGYSGNKLDLKQQLLSVEGVRTKMLKRHLRVARDTMYHLHRGDQEYCLPTCGSLKSLSLSQVTLFGSRERAEAAGLAPCTSCRPDLHPLAS